MPHGWPFIGPFIPQRVNYVQQIVLLQHLLRLRTWAVSRIDCRAEGTGPTDNLRSAEGNDTLLHILAVKPLLHIYTFLEATYRFIWVCSCAWIVKLAGSANIPTYLIKL